MASSSADQHENQPHFSLLLGAGETDELVDIVVEGASKLSEGFGLERDTVLLASASSSDNPKSEFIRLRSALGSSWRSFKRYKTSSIKVDDELLLEPLLVLVLDLYTSCTCDATFIFCNKYDKYLHKKQIRALAYASYSQAIVTLFPPTCWSKSFASPE